MKIYGPRVLLEQMIEAASRATSFIDGMELEDFLGDIRTQQAVAMSLINIGEMATRIERDHSQFHAAYSDLSWSKMKGIRNRIAHGYIELDFSVVWDTTAVDLPELIAELTAILDDPAIPLD
jgi:uncharacterized protein with HEPN domain